MITYSTPNLADLRGVETYSYTNDWVGGGVNGVLNGNWEQHNFNYGYYTNIFGAYGYYNSVGHAYGSYSSSGSGTSPYYADAFTFTGSTSGESGGTADGSFDVLGNGTTGLSWSSRAFGAGGGTNTYTTAGSDGTMDCQNEGTQTNNDYETVSQYLIFHHSTNYFYLEDGRASFASNSGTGGHTACGVACIQGEQCGSESGSRSGEGYGTTNLVIGNPVYSTLIGYDENCNTIISSWINGFGVQGYIQQFGNVSPGTGPTTFYSEVNETIGWFPGWPLGSIVLANFPVFASITSNSISTVYLTGYNKSSLYTTSYTKSITTGLSTLTGTFTNTHQFYTYTDTTSSTFCTKCKTGYVINAPAPVGLGSEPNFYILGASVADTIFSFIENSGTISNNDIVWIVTANEWDEGIITDLAQSYENDFTLYGGDYATTVTLPVLDNIPTNTYSIQYNLAETNVTTTQANFVNEFVIPYTNSSTSIAVYTTSTSRSVSYNWEVTGDNFSVTSTTTTQENIINLIQILTNTRFLGSFESAAIYNNLTTSFTYYPQPTSSAIPQQGFTTNSDISLFRTTTTASTIFGVPNRSQSQSGSSQGQYGSYSSSGSVGGFAYTTSSVTKATNMMVGANISPGHIPDYLFNLTYTLGAIFLPYYEGAIFPFNYTNPHNNNFNVYYALSADFSGDITKVLNSNQTTNLGSLYRVCEMGGINGARPIYSIMFDNSGVLIGSSTGTTSTSNGTINSNYTSSYYLSYKAFTNTNTTNTNTTDLNKMILKLSSKTTTTRLTTNSLINSTMYKTINGTMTINLLSAADLNQVTGLTSFWPTNQGELRSNYYFYGGNPGGSGNPVSRWRVIDYVPRYLTTNWGGESSYSTSTIGIDSFFSELNTDSFHIVAESIGKYPYIQVLNGYPQGFLITPSFSESKFIINQNHFNGFPLDYQVNGDFTNYWQYFADSAFFQFTIGLNYYQLNDGILGARFPYSFTN